MVKVFIMCKKKKKSDCIRCFDFLTFGIRVCVKSEVKISSLRINIFIYLKRFVCVCEREREGKENSVQ